MPTDYKRAIAQHLDEAKLDVQAAQSQGNGNPSTKLRTGKANGAKASGAGALKASKR